MGKAPRLLLFAAGIVGLLGFPTAGVTGPERPKGAGTVTAVAGPVTVVRLAAAPQPLKFRDDLYWRDVVEAGKDGIARVLLVGKTTVTVRELSRLELREEALAEGVRYTVELASGKVRAAVARMLMQQGEQLEVRTRNAVASVRGTDFIVETVGLPSPRRALGLLGVWQVGEAGAGGGSKLTETVVVTLSGLVEVSNRLSSTGRVERIGTNQAVRVVGTQDPVRFGLGVDDLKRYLRGLTPPRPKQVQSGDRAEAVGNKVEQGALETSVPRGSALEQSGNDAPKGGSQGDSQTTQGGSQSEAQSNAGASQSGNQGQGSASGGGPGSNAGNGQGSASGGGQGSASGGDPGSSSGGGQGSASGGGPGSNSGNGQGSASGAGQGSSSGGGQGAPSGGGLGSGQSGGPGSGQGTGVGPSPGGGPGTGLAIGKGSSGLPPGQAKK